MMRYLILTLLLFLTACEAPYRRHATYKPPPTPTATAPETVAVEAATEHVETPNKGETEIQIRHYTQDMPEPDELDAGYRIWWKAFVGHLANALSDSLEKEKKNKKLSRTGVWHLENVLMGEVKGEKGIFNVIHLHKDGQDTGINLAAKLDPFDDAEEEAGKVSDAIIAYIKTGKIKIPGN